LNIYEFHLTTRPETEYCCSVNKWNNITGLWIPTVKKHLIY